MNFLLGVGAQRSGTSWLARYLRQHPQVFMTPYKELHVFDTMLAPEVSGYTPETRFRELRQMLSKVVSGETWSKNELQVAIERYALSLSDRAYLEYFTRHVRPEHRSIGEITPSYSLIPPRGFEFIRSLLVNERLTPRVVFIMRDPVERFFSQLRFDRQLGLRSAPDARALSSPGVMLRSRYDLTISNLKSQFPPDEVLFLFYEDLFSDHSLDSICRFLDIDFKQADFSERVNDTSSGDLIDPDVRAAAREQLDVVYEFCADKFGRETIRDLWPGY